MKKRYRDRGCRGVLAGPRGPRKSLHLDITGMTSEWQMLVPSSYPWIVHA